MGSMALMVIADSALQSHALVHYWVLAFQAFYPCRASPEVAIETDGTSAPKQPPLSGNAFTWLGRAS